MDKISKYNFFIQNNNQIICFNGISRFIFSLNKEEYEFLKKSLENLDDFNKKYPSYYALLKKNFFIVDDDLSEYDYIRYLNRLAVFSNNSYRITINPTLECNFKCWYCYETHPQGFMSDRIKSGIINHIEYVGNNKLVKGLDLTWFGGEPLLYFDKIVFPISLKAKKVFEKNNLNFSNHATTNAYLIDEKMIKKFNQINLNSFQVTIDGIKEEHNKIRNENGKPSFDRIMENINMLCKNNKNAYILLRINYTDKTLSNISSLLDYIPLSLNRQINLGFHRVWQTIDKINTSSNDAAKENLTKIIDQAIQKGFMCSYPESFPERYVRCYADRYWHTEINYDGNVYKCTMDYNKKPHGKLLENGTIEWDKSRIAQMYSQATFENEMCKNCKMLPVCLGPCSRKIVEENNCGECLGSLCNMKNSEIGYEKLILDHYNYLKKQYENNQ
jgi:uncharacterized protein